MAVGQVSTPEGPGSRLGVVTASERGEGLQA